MKQTVWATGCQSWYLDGAGKNVSNWPGYVVEYQLRTRRPDFSHFIHNPAPRP
ncbi:MAG: hypothetical protein AAFV53_36925 [Myxococcota bacterium]